MSSSRKTDIAAQRTEVRARTPMGATVGRDAEVLYLAVTTADGKRRILRDNLGTLGAVPEGWELRIPGHGPQVFADRDEALDEAKGALGDV